MDYEIMLIQTIFCLIILTLFDGEDSAIILQGSSIEDGKWERSSSIDRTKPPSPIQRLQECKNMEKIFPQGNKTTEKYLNIPVRGIAPSIPLGYKYCKSKNDIYKKKMAIFVFSFLIFAPSAFGSTNLSFHVSSPLLPSGAASRKVRRRLTTMWAPPLPDRPAEYNDFPRYQVRDSDSGTLYSRDFRQIQNYALPFFARFSDRPKWPTMWNGRGSFPIGRGSMSQSGIGSSSNASGVSPKHKRMGYPTEQSIRKVSEVYLMDYF